MYGCVCVTAGSRFDLSSLQRTAGEGDFEASSPDYKYYLNVCGDTTLVPHQCKHTGVDNSPAYQVSLDDSHCVSLTPT